MSCVEHVQDDGFFFKRSGHVYVHSAVFCVYLRLRSSFVLLLCDAVNVVLLLIIRFLLCLTNERRSSADLLAFSNSTPDCRVYRYNMLLLLEIELSGGSVLNNKMHRDREKNNKNM